jgi:MFS family permease
MIDDDRPAHCYIPSNPLENGIATNASVPEDAPEALEATDAPEQRRTLQVLVAAQILSGAGLAAGITVGALLAKDMLGSTSLSGLPAMLFTVGAAASAVGIGRVSHLRGRRVGLAGGYFVGALGALGVVIAAATASVPLLLVSLVIYGGGSAANLQARYAGADLAAPKRRARAVSIVLLATTVGAVAGPNVSSAMERLASSWGIPGLAGPFVLASGAYAVASVVLWVALRPDPLLVAREHAAHRQNTGDTSHDVYGGDEGSRSQVALGATVMVTAQMVMIAVMTMTPIYMVAHHHTLGATGAVIGAHVAAMYLPSPLSGWLVDRYGARLVAASSAVVFLACGIVVAVSPPDSVLGVMTALILLGFGWSLGLISGTAMVTAGAPAPTRAKVQGNVDFLIALAGAMGGALSGIVVAYAGYPALALGGGLLALLLIPVVVRRARSDAKDSVGA